MRESQERERRQIKYADAKARAEKQDASGSFNAFRLPKGVKQFKFDKADTYRLRVLPYEVSDRAIDHRFADPGFYHYEYSYWIHNGLGPDNKERHCCLRESFKKRCPVCDHLSTLDRWGKDKEIYAALKPKQRQLFALFDARSDEMEVQIYETSFFAGMGAMTLGQTLDNKTKANPDKYAGFFRLVGGMELEVSVKQGKPFNGKPTWNLFNVELEKGPDLDDSVVDNVPCLDKLPIELSYDELLSVFNQKGVPPSKDDLKQQLEAFLVKSEAKDSNNGNGSEYEKPRHPEKIDHDFQAGDEVEFDGEILTIKKLDADGTLILKDEDGMVTRGINPKECKKRVKGKSAREMYNES